MDAQNFTKEFMTDLMEYNDQLVYTGWFDMENGHYLRVYSLKDVEAGKETFVCEHRTKTEKGKLVLLNSSGAPYYHLGGAVGLDKAVPLSDMVQHMENVSSLPKAPHADAVNLKNKVTLFSTAFPTRESELKKLPIGAVCNTM